MVSIDQLTSIAKVAILSLEFALAGVIYFRYREGLVDILLVTVFIFILALLLFYYFNEWYTGSRLGEWDQFGSDDIALVTGGSQGLGSEIVKQLLEKHVRVIVFDIVEPSFNGAEYYHCDLANRAQLEALVNELIQQLNEKGQNISLLINNAGIRHNESLLNLSDRKIETIFEINMFAQIWLIRAVLKNHIDRFSSKRLYMVTISSILGVLAPKNLSIYSASKAAIIQIHQALSQEVLLKTIRLLLVTPGQLTTGMFEDVVPSKEYLAPIVDHVELAKKIVTKMDKGSIGVLCEPFYTNFIPMINSLPVSLQQFCRWFSGMDDKIKETPRE